MKYGVWILWFLCTVPCWTQTTTTGPAQSKGPCSPAITGGKNTINLNCEEQKKQPKKPVLEVRAVLYHAGKPFTSQLLDPKNHGSTIMSLVSNEAGYLEAAFILRDTGTAEAFRANVQALPPLDVRVACIEYVGLEAIAQQPYKPCDFPPDPGPNIRPRPKNRPATFPLIGQPTADFDTEYDIEVKIHFIVPPGLPGFTLPLVVSADGLEPTRYIVECDRGPGISGSAIGIVRPQ